MLFFFDERLQVVSDGAPQGCAVFLFPGGCGVSWASQASLTFDPGIFKADSSPGHSICLVTSTCEWPHQLDEQTRPLSDCLEVRKMDLPL